MRYQRHIISIVLVAFAFVLATAPADAARKWCHKDPVVRIGGAQVNIDVAVYEDQQKLVTGAIKVSVSVPQGIATELVMTDDGFNGFGETVSFSTDKRLKATKTSIQFRILIEVPAKSKIPAQVVVSPSGGKKIAISGRTNSTFSATGNVALPKKK